METGQEPGESCQLGLDFRLCSRILDSAGQRAGGIGAGSLTLARAWRRRGFRWPLRLASRVSSTA